jgi:para-aminobenzoate synthetase component 1
MLISQPIKGTIRRGRTRDEDEELKNILANDPKELSENVMIVDVVRNDLSRVARQGTVSVKELFGIYTFDRLHQMISTITCEIKEGTSFTEILRATFPMGSMTGAPKIRAMQLIEQFENHRRGLYSGSIGYFSPDGDFDFNVVIRSMLYNSSEKFLAFSAGSAITHASVPESEYAECELKSESMSKVIGAVCCD